jgi:hypothetical protein
MSISRWGSVPLLTCDGIKVFVDEFGSSVSQLESYAEVGEGSMLPWETCEPQETMVMSMSPLPRPLEWEPVILMLSLLLAPVMGGSTST